MPEHDTTTTSNSDDSQESPRESPQPVMMEDPSEYRPELKDMMLGKEQDDFRLFYKEDSEKFPLIRKTYFNMHTKQTHEFVTEKYNEWCKLNHFEMTIMDAIQMMDLIIDESDPDTSLPNSLHCFQTAERIRETHPNEDWFHLVGLIHDIGKVLALHGEPQWATVGDTFPVGCAFSDQCVFPEFFKDNPDNNDPRYNTKYGIYKPNCGLKNVKMSFGHDEYMYHVLIGNNTTLPAEGLACIRYHSFYPWHTGGDYEHLCNDEDISMLKWIREFNKYDLYSKADVLPDVAKLTPYYQSLIDKYIPGKIKW